MWKEERKLLPVCIWLVVFILGKAFYGMEIDVLRVRLEVKGGVDTVQLGVEIVCCLPWSK